VAITVPTRTLTAREFQTVYDALVQHVRRTRPDLWTDFFQSSLGTSLVELLSAVGDWASFGQDAALLEMFLATCRRYESGLAYARSVGYTPLQAAAASASVFANIPPSTSLLAYGGVVPAGSVLSGDNGLVYEFVEDVLVPAGASSVRAQVVQGASYTESFAPNPAPNPSVTVENANVVQGSWRVYVGDPADPVNEWRQVDAVSLEPSASQTYEVLFDAASRMTVRFGDGVYGAIPAQTITVKYRTCSGAAGNTPVRTIRGPVAVRLNSPATGTTSIEFENYDPLPATEGNVSTQVGELGVPLSGGSGSFAVVVPLAHAPVKPGTLVLTLRFLGGGQIVLQDDAYGNLIVSGTTVTIPDLTNPPSNLLGVLSAYINYSTGECSITLTSDVPPANAGEQPISDYDYFVSTDPLSAIVQGAATGGADREDLEALRQSVKVFVKSQDRFITTTDYDQGLLRLPGVALAKTDARPLAYTGNVVRLNVWADETVTFRSVPYDGLVGTASYRRYVTAAPALSAQVQQFVKDKSLVSVHHVVSRPGILWVDLYFRDLAFDPRADAQAVRDGVTAAVVSAFQEGSGFEMRLSELYAAIYRVPGVAYFTLHRAAVGTMSQSAPAEALGFTAASPVFSAQLPSVGTVLGGALLRPRSLRVSIDQGVDRLILADDGVGGMVQVAGVSNTLAPTGNTVDYVTGLVQLTFNSSLTAGAAAVATYDNIIGDYRQNPRLTKNSLDDGDWWPSPSPLAAQFSPVSTTLVRYDGRPLTMPGAVDIEYESLRDIVVESALVDLRFYDDAYLYDNSFYYDSEMRFNKPMRAINLRLLDFRAAPRA